MKRHRYLVLLVLVNMTVGLFMLPGFGESTDELSQHSYAERTIRGVTALFTSGPWPAFFFNEESKQGSHGPAFIVAVVLLRNLFLPDGSPVEKLQFSHFLYFLTFQAGIVSLFFLARRWVSEMAAFGTTLLFATQPLLVGHAFMNPKDVVFMSLLTASAALGFWMVDRAGAHAPGEVLSLRVRAFFGAFLRADVWLAGLVLGFSSAIRVAAPLIGAVILLDILLTRRWQALPRFFAYGLIAFGSMVLFWPYLWPDPFGRLIESLLHSAQYPDVHLTLFRGMLVDAKATPRSYLPVLLAVQLTETALVAMLAGALSLLRKFHKDLAALVLIWFLLPVTIMIGLRVNLYDNFRQVFFILPPLFLLAGLGLQRLFALIQRPAGRALAVFLLLLPGLYANITLYPYQYVYYNQLAGGIRGAYRVFEMDYWRLAFREAQSYVNQAASPGANVFVGNSKPNAQTFARPDLIFNALGGRKKNWGNYDYIIVSTAENSDQQFAEFPTVFVVERDGVPLAYVKKP